MTVGSIAEEVNIDRETLRKILTEDLDMSKLCTKVVPKQLLMNKSKEKLNPATTFLRGKMTLWAVVLQVMSHGSPNTILK